MIAWVRRSLGARILLLAGFNLALLIAIGIFASGIRFPRSFEELLMQSAEPRLQDVARRIALDLERAPQEQATPLLTRYGVEYGAQFILVQNDGTRIAGASLALPREMTRALTGPPPSGRGGPRPPKKGPPDRLGPSVPVGPPDPQSGLRMPQVPARLVVVDGSPRYWIMVRTPIRFAGQTEIVPGSLLVVPEGLFADKLLFPVAWLGWALLALAVTVACWLPFLRGVTRSLGRMERATARIAHGQFDTTVGVARADELGRLSSSIEAMSGRLGALVSGQKRFLGDTAHELRSPLGRMQVALEILERRTAEGDRAYVADLKEDVGELIALTDELLLYARAELKERGGARDTVALPPIIERVVAREGEGAAITISVPDAVSVRGDAVLIERAIANVVRNAVKYAGSAGPIVVETTTSERDVTVSVVDAGPGVAPESLGRLFEPFYREDVARARKTGGTGLGLAIVRSAIEACGGTVNCVNRQPRGLEVRLVLARG